MRLRKGDNVKVAAGKNRGKTGKIIQAFPDRELVVVEGVNMMKKHVRVRKEGEKGQTLEFAGPVRASAVMLICPKCTKTTRIAMKMLVGEDGKTQRVRACKKCGESIE